MSERNCPALARIGRGRRGRRNIPAFVIAYYPIDGDREATNHTLDFVRLSERRK